MDPERPHNLYAPLPGDYGARGPFDDCTAAYSLQAWGNRHRGWLALAGLRFAALMMALLEAEIEVESLIIHSLPAPLPICEVTHFIE